SACTRSGMAIRLIPSQATVVGFLDEVEDLSQAPFQRRAPFHTQQNFRPHKSTFWPHFSEMARGLFSLVKNGTRKSRGLVEGDGGIGTVKVGVLGQCRDRPPLAQHLFGFAMTHSVNRALLRIVRGRPLAPRFQQLVAPAMEAPANPMPRSGKGVRWALPRT